MPTYSSGRLFVTPKGGAEMELATLRGVVIHFAAKEKPLFGSASTAIDEAAYGVTATIKVEECAFNEGTITALVAAAVRAASIVPFPPLVARFDFLDPLDGRRKRTTLRNVLAPNITLSSEGANLTKRNVMLFGHADENDIVSETDLIPA